MSDELLHNTRNTPGRETVSERESLQASHGDLGGSGQATSVNEMSNLTEKTDLDRAKDDSASAKIWEDESSLTCAFCKLSFSSKSAILVHLLTHIDVTCKEHLPLHKTKLCYYNNRYQCHNCKIKTRHRGMFQEHVRHHVLRMPYTCAVCSTDFPNLIDFKSHITGGGCTADDCDLIVKPTEIVNQVMNMLGPNAPPTEQSYSLNKEKAMPPKDRTTPNPLPPVMNPSPSTSSDQSLPNIIGTLEPCSIGIKNISMSDGKVSQQPSAGVPSFSQTKLSAVHNKEQLKVQNIDGATSDQQSLDAVGNNDILLRNKLQTDDSGMGKETSVDEVCVESLNNQQEPVWKPLILEVTSGQPLPISANSSLGSETQINADSNTNLDKIAEAVSCSMMDQLISSQPLLTMTFASAVTSSGSEGNKVISGHSGVKSLDKSSEVTIVCPGKVAPTHATEFDKLLTVSSAQTAEPKPRTSQTRVSNEGMLSSSGMQPIMIEDDDIQVVQVSHPQSAPREDAQMGTSPGDHAGKSAEHPIIINDDDLHQATNSTQNKIKIERQPNGIMLRLFQDQNGLMKDLSQLGLEVRNEMWYCCRCEHSFTFWKEFLTHVSDELHAIFSFHAGLCPVCKYSPNKPKKDATPCKLARILLRVLSVVYRSIEKSKVSSQNVESSRDKSTGVPLPQVSFTACPVINIAPQASFQTKPTTITMPQTSPIPYAPVVTGSIPAQNSSPNQSSNVAISTVPSGSPIVIMPQEPAAMPANQTTGPGTVLIIPVQQPGVLPPSSSGQFIAPIVIAPTPIGSVDVDPVTESPTAMSKQGPTPVSDALTLNQSAPIQQPLIQPAPTLLASNSAVHTPFRETNQGSCATLRNLLKPDNPAQVKVTRSNIDSSNLGPRHILDSSEAQLRDDSSRIGRANEIPVGESCASESNTSLSASIQAVKTSKDQSKICSLENNGSAVKNTAEPIFQKKRNSLQTVRDTLVSGEETMPTSAKDMSSQSRTAVSMECSSETQQSIVVSGVKKTNFNPGKQAIEAEQKIGDLSQKRSDSEELSRSKADRDKRVASVISKLPALSPKPITDGSHASSISKAAMVAMKKNTKRKQPVRRDRVFVGKFMYRNRKFICLSCRYFTPSENTFKKHLSKHVHGKLSSKFCTHCPPYIVYNKLKHCPVLKQMITFMKLAAKMKALKKKAQTEIAKSSGQESASLIDVGIDDDCNQSPSNSQGHSENAHSDQKVEDHPPKTVGAGQTSECVNSPNDKATDKMANSAPSSKVEEKVLQQDTSVEQKEMSDDAQDNQDDDNDAQDNQDDGGDEAVCRRIMPFETNKPWPVRKELEAKLAQLTPLESTPSHGPKLSIRCAVDDCEFRTVEEDNFRIHNYLKHPTVPLIPCSYCSKSFGDIDELILHFNIHRDWVYKCSFEGCSFGARKIPDYESHLVEKHSNEGQFRCCFCTKHMTTIASIVNHIALHVSIQIKCPYCEKTSSEKKEVQVHIAERHKDQPKKVVVSTQIIPNLDESMLQTTSADQNPEHKEAGVRPVQPSNHMPPPPSPPKHVPFPQTNCEKCTFVSLSQEQVDSHAKLHQSEQNKESNFFCRQCPFSCNQLEEYRLHVQQHTGTTTMRIYMCAHCSFSTMHMTMIEDHLANDHENDPFKFEVLQEKVNHMQLMEPCKVCGELILNTSSHYMTEHNVKYHNGASVDGSSSITIERYHCDMCPYSAQDDVDLANHLDQAHGIREESTTATTTTTGSQGKEQYTSPMKIIEQVQAAKKTMALYECDLCSYKTANKKMFIDHHRQHAEGISLNSYKCEFCPYESTKYKNLVSHQRVHSRPMEEGYKCSYCYYMNTIKSRVSWHISAYHPGKEKKIVEISNKSGSSSSQSTTPKKSKQSNRGNPESTVHTYQQQLQRVGSDGILEVAVQKSGKHDTSFAVTQCLNDEDLKDFERNLPSDAVFKHPVHCPFCPFSNSIRQDMLQHLKSHVKSKSVDNEKEVSTRPDVTAAKAAVSRSPLTFFKKSTEISVFQCYLCEYVHVNGSDMVRHFLCEHATLGCSLCQHHAITTSRMREHYSTVHNSNEMDIYLRQGDKQQKLTESDFQKIETMERQTMLQEGETEDSQESDLVDEDYDFDDESAEVLKHCKKLKINNRLRYRCIYCGYTNGLPLIRRHVLSVHMKFLAFLCKYCKTRCREKYHLQQHIRNVHPGSPVIIHRRKFNPLKHGKIIKTSVDNLHWRKRKHSESDDGMLADGSESEQSHSIDAGSFECFTPSRESVSSLDSTAHSVSLIGLASGIKQENVDKSAMPRLSRTPDSQVMNEAGEQQDVTDSSDDVTAFQKGKKKLSCGYCDYSSQYSKQDIQRHILLKHLQIHMFTCKKCKFATNNKRTIAQHRKENKGHGYWDFTYIKDKIVEIHQDGSDIVYGFPEGQLTECQQHLEKIPGLHQQISAGTIAQMRSDIAMADSSCLSMERADSETAPMGDVNQSLTSSPSSPKATTPDHDDVRPPLIVGVKSLKDAAHIKLPKMAVYSCAYCEYTSKYNRGDVKKHILFKHFANKKYTCGYCNFGTWEEQMIRMHFPNVHPSLPENIIDNSFESQCIVPIMTTDRCLTLGIRTPPDSPIQLQKNIVHQCKLCSVEEPNMIKLKLHIIVKHWNLKPYQCPICKDQRWKRYAIEDHLRKVHPEATEPPVVTYIKKSAELLNLVKKKVIFSALKSSVGAGSAAKKADCILCEYVAPNQADLEMHMKTHSIYSCIYCPFQAASKPAVQSHIESKHPDYPIRIKTCLPVALTNKPSTSFSASDSVSSPQKRKSMEGMDDDKAPLRKKICHRFGSGQQGYSNAKLKVILTNAYKCDICNHQVDKLRDILEHLCKHFNYYRFVCSYCDVRTTRAYLIKTHLEKKHPNQDPIYKVNTDDQLEAEIRKRYTIIKRTPKRNKECVMFCPLCAKRCGRQSSLREHIMRDLNYRPYLCPFCDYCECTGGKVNFHMHQTHKDGSGRYEVKLNHEIASKVDKLMEEAKRNAEQNIFPKVVLPKRTPSPSAGQSKSKTLVVKFPKMQSKDPMKLKLKFPIKMEVSDDKSTIPLISSTDPDQIENFRFKCHMCTYGTNKEKLLKSHLMRSHGTKRWKCFYCDCKAVYRSTIIKHVRDSHKHKRMKVVQILPTSKESHKDEPDVEVVLAPTAYGKAEPQLLSLLKNRPGGGRDLPTVKGTGRLLESEENEDSLVPDKHGVYHCPSCLYSTPNKRLLKMHLLCHKKADLECFYCKRIYRVMFRLRRHCRVRHKGRPVKWLNRTTGELKEESASAAQSYSSAVGPTSAPPSPSFTDVTKSPQTLYCCHLCNECTTSAPALFQHVRETHSGNESASTPPSRRSSTQSEANGVPEADASPHHGGGLPSEPDEQTKAHGAGKPFRCFYCNYSCFYRSDARRHCQRKHPDRRVAFVSQNAKQHPSTSKGHRQPCVLLADVLTLPGDKLRSLLERNSVKMIDTSGFGHLEEAESSVSSASDDVIRPERRRVSGLSLSRRPRRLQCTIDGCGRMFSYSFDVYRHQRSHHNISSAMYQKGVGATFKAFRVLGDRNDSDN